MSNYVNFFKEEVIPGYVGLDGSTGNGAGLGQIGATISLWRQRSKQRLALKNLDSRMLNDIGLSHELAVEEAAKPFWQD